jgi:hypothetical protein
MKTPEGFDQCYNAQAAVDAACLVIVAHEVTASPTDVQRLTPMLDTIKAETGRYPDQLSAVSGYMSEGNLRGCEERGVDAYVALRRFNHDEPPDADPAPQQRGAGRPAVGCGTGSAAQTGARRMPSGRDSRASVRQVKACRGFRQFLLRGLGAVRGEWALLCTVHNLLRLYGATWAA